MKNLLKAIPQLEGKISEVENLTSQFSPISNISEDIKNIKELIKQARDAANRVRPHTQMYSLCGIHPVYMFNPWPVTLLNICFGWVLFTFFMSLFQIVIPMKFTGKGYVEMRTPKNLDDLKAYTSLSLSLQRPEGSGDNRRRRRQTSDDMFVLYLGSRDVRKSKGTWILWFRCTL